MKKRFFLTPKFWFITVSFLCSYLMMNSVYATKVVNVFVWGGEIPPAVVHQFEKETGIKVNFSTYDNNEAMFAKLKASRKPVYDVIQPSGYFVERMKKQGMLMPLPHNELSNLKNLEPFFTKNAFDVNNQYSVPIIWGTTGIFYNQSWVTEGPKRWQDLWQPRWKNQLMLLDDSREVFSIGLMRLGYPPNDSNPEHIKAAYQTLLQLIPNVKLFAMDNVQAIAIDEDAIAGTIWNGDAYRTHEENEAIRFVYPEDGFVIWVDCLAIPQNAPHVKEALTFINFVLRPDIAALLGEQGHAITNQAGKKQLPRNLRESNIVYPPISTLEHGYFQRDVSDKALELYNHYWERLKLSF